MKRKIKGWFGIKIGIKNYKDKIFESLENEGNKMYFRLSIDNNKVRIKKEIGKNVIKEDVTLEGKLSKYVMAWVENVDGITHFFLFLLDSK